MFAKVIAHGMWGGAQICAELGTKLPGPGSIYLNPNLIFLPRGVAQEQAKHREISPLVGVTIGKGVV